MSRTVMIHSDGTGHGTVVLDEDGKKLANVTNLTASVDANSVVEVVLEVRHVSLNLKGEVPEVFFICPCCSESIMHQCDTVFGGETATLAAQCGSILKLLAPAYEGRCIRGKGHDMKHFDGDKSWSQ